MAQRYGGRHSPGKATGGTVSPTARVDPAGARANLLFLPAIPLVFTSLDEGPLELVVALIAAGALTLAAWLLRDGLRAEAAFHERKVARRPAIPRKMMASALTGLGTALAAWTGQVDTIGAVLYGVAATGLHVAAFGIDPLANKRMEGVDSFQQDRVARAVDEGERHLQAMSDAISRLGDRGLEARVNRFRDTARQMFRTVEEDPRDLSGARRWLGVYLLGARDATVKFADLYARNRDPAVKEDYVAFLTDLEENFAARTDKMLVDDRTDMDIEIKVLRDRLRREGVAISDDDQES